MASQQNRRDVYRLERLGFAAFGIRPTPVEAVVPDYLARYRAWIHRPRDGRAGN